MSKELLVVFDIDETLIHYMGKQYRHLFYELEPEYQERLNPIIDGDPDGEHGIIIPRPYLQELFDFTKEFILGEEVFPLELYRKQKVQI